MRKTFYRELAVIVTSVFFLNVCVCVWCPVVRFQCTLRYLIRLMFVKYRYYSIDEVSCGCLGIRHVQKGGESLLDSFHVFITRSSGDKAPIFVLVDIRNEISRVSVTGVQTNSHRSRLVIEGQSTQAMRTSKLNIFKVAYGCTLAKNVLLWVED